MNFEAYRKAQSDRYQAEAKDFGEMAGTMGGLAATFDDGRSSLLKDAAQLEAEVSALRKAGGHPSLEKSTLALAKSHRELASKMDDVAQLSRRIGEKLDGLASAPMPGPVLSDGDGR